MIDGSERLSLGSKLSGCGARGELNGERKLAAQNTNVVSCTFEYLQLSK